MDRPVLKLRPESLENYLSMQVFAKILEEYNENGMIFDRIFFRDPFNCQDSVDVLASALKNLPKNLVADGQQIVISQRIPSKGQKIWELIYNQVLTESTRNAYEGILKKMENAEKEFFGNEENPLFDWNENSVKTAFEEQGFCVKSATKVITEKRRITETEINRWFDAENSSYGSAMAREIGTEDLAKIKNLLTAACQNTLFNWNTTIEFLTVKIQADTTQKKGL